MSLAETIADADLAAAKTQRALLFGYYSRDFIRPQTNWNATLSPATIAALSPQMRGWLGPGPTASIGLAAPLAIPRPA
jgi:hypothetical protein